MRWPKMLGALLSTAVFIGVGAHSAYPSVLLGEDFEKGIGGKATSASETPWGRGWRAAVGGDVGPDEAEYLQYPAEGSIDPDRGTVEFEVVRNNTGGKLEAYFSLLNEEGRTILSARIWWDKYRNFKDAPILQIATNRITYPWSYLRHSESHGTWQDPGIPIRSISKGKKFHVAMTWGDSTSDRNLYLNGRKLDTVVGEPFELGKIIRQAKWIVIGAEPAGDGRVWSQSHSVIKSVHIYDEPLNGADLFANPEKYRVSDQAPAIASLGHDAARVAGFSGRLVAGDTVTVSMEGAAGAEASFDVAQAADIRGEIPVSWKGWGVYLEEITFFEEDQVDLRDVDEYRVYASPDPIGGITLETEFVESLEVDEQSTIVDRVVIESLEGDEVSYTREPLAFGVPYYIAVMAVMDDDTLRPVISPAQGLAMAEVEGSPGIYEGAFTAGYRHRYRDAVVVGRLARGTAAATQVVDEAFEIDPSLTLTVEASPDELKADEKSTSEITVTVTDANEKPVSGHEVRFVLATTSQYTGVVGGGQFAEEVGGALKEEFRGETDLFGRVTATYTAGFAAKTAIIVARDMMSNDTGAGYVKTYINATAELELEAPQVVAGKALGYVLTVTSSDEWLTADGQSEARITALLTRGGAPVEGQRVSFSVSSGAGRIRTVKGITGTDGKALAVYTAGTKIGMVLIRAAAHEAGVVGSVQIELRSDAPAKIAITVDPEVLPADGRSTAEVGVVVTDINDNPNEGVEVEYVVAIGSGRLRSVDEVTDRDGESSALYVAGRIPGKVSIEVTVRSTVPTEEELTAARDLGVAVLDYDFF